MTWGATLKPLALLAAAATFAVFAPAAAPAKLRPLGAGDVATVTLAAVQARAAGTYQSAARPIPAGTYSAITVSLTNAGGLDFTGDTGFVQGDEVDGEIDISTDGGTTWQTFISAQFLGGNPSPRTHGYSVSVLDVDIPANTVYRGTMVVRPGAQGAKITCGAQGSATTG